MNDQDQLHMHQAYELAKIRRGFCAPNPSVGAVIVRDNTILATGYHQGPGTAHAERDALKKLSNQPLKNATLYVSLEPCCHFGRTPPCTDAIIEAGFSRVVYGYRDPNPVVGGKGEALLKAAGIACEHLPLPEIVHFYESYRHWHATKKPFITAKIAMSMDGKIASQSGEPIQITGEALKELTHYSRQASDALLTTVKTILHDDPQLNVRIADEVIAKPLYILDRHLNLPLTAKIFSTAKSITVFHAKTASADRLQQLRERGVRCYAVDENSEGLLLNQVIDLIGQDGVHDLWVEAGGQCFAAFMHEKLAQKALIYIAPKWLGAGKTAFASDFSFNFDKAQVRWQQVGEDILCEAHW